MQVYIRIRRKLLVAPYAANLTDVRTTIRYAAGGEAKDDSSPANVDQPLLLGVPRFYCVIMAQMDARQCGQAVQDGSTPNKDTARKLAGESA